VQRYAVYHLRNKLLYRLIGGENNRNRRPVVLPRIAQKVMVLDYVLSRPSVEWLATEADKVAFFTAKLGVSAPDLPGRCYVGQNGDDETRRHFVGKLPIGIDPDGTTVHFVYLLTESTAAGFRAFLRAHEPLLAALERWTLTLVSPPQITASSACASAFDAWADGQQRAAHVTPYVLFASRDARRAAASHSRARPATGISRRRSATCTSVRRRSRARFACSNP
jgi:hypothetical protein